MWNFPPQQLVSITNLGVGRLQGSVYVTRRATSWLESKLLKMSIQGASLTDCWFIDKLKDSNYGTRQDINQMAKVFDKTTKLSFRSEVDTGYIQFGSLRDKDMSVGINRGQLKIPGWVLNIGECDRCSDLADREIMKSFFTPSVDEILEAIQEQRKEVGAGTPISVSTSHLSCRSCCDIDADNLI